MNMRAKHKRAFENRFDIDIDFDDAQQRFVNRLFNKIDDKFLGFTTNNCALQEWVPVFKHVANKLGHRYIGNNFLVYYSGKDFLQVLRTIEALYEGFSIYPYGHAIGNLEDIIESTIAESEIDLGIRWKDGHFYRSGAKLLDDGLVAEPLKWLDNPKYLNVLKPFESGLRLYMEANIDPSKLAKVAEDMCEASEALARIVCNNNSSINDNIEELVTKLQLAKNYEKILKEYVSYSNRYRHAGNKDKPKEPPNPNEIEALIYLTGLFIRLSIKQFELGEVTAPKPASS